MEHREQNTAVPESGTAKKPNLWKIGLFTLVPIVALLLVFVLVILLTPVVRLASVNGIYYASVDGELSKEEYIRLQSGKWTAPDGSGGEYDFLGGELLLSRKDSSDETFHYHATVQNGVLIIEGQDENNVFVKETHEHEYGEIVSEEINNCVEGGLSICLCICGKQMTQPIGPRSHDYYTEIAKNPTCVESGEILRGCRNCLWTETEQTKPTGVHLSFSDGQCESCGAVQLKYELSKDGTHYIVTGFATGFSGSSTISIMKNYEGLPVTEIAAGAFSRGNLRDVEIPDGITEINSGAFYNCTALGRVSISASVTSLGENPFDGCMNLRVLTVRAGNPVYHSLGNCVIQTEKKELVVACDPFVIPADGSVEAINAYAFSTCTTVPRIVIPKSVTHIAPFVFRNCRGLSGIMVEEGNPVYHDMGNCIIETATKTLVAGCRTSVIPNDGSVTKIGEGAFAECSGFMGIIIPNTVTEIGASAFAGCNWLQSITIPNTVTVIGESAFADCDRIKSITIPFLVKKIGKSAFAGCDAMTDIDFKCSALEIGKGAFSSCTSLEKISIKKDTQFLLSEETFTNCRNLKVIYYEGTLEEWNRIKADVYGFNRYMTIHCTDIQIINFPPSKV